MKKALRIVSVLLLSTILCFGAGCAKQQESKNVTLTISAAASLKDSLNEVKELYKSENPNVTLVINYGSSGMLQQQIEQGADVDIFISAASKQMNALEKKDLIINDTRKDILLNDVVLIVPNTNSTITGFDDLVKDNVKNISLGEPKSVPAGQYAEEVFTKLGILDKIKSKAVYAKDVKQVLASVETESADAGVVYATDAKVSDKVKVAAVAPADSHSPVVYPAAVIKSSKQSDAAKNFMNFLVSDKAKAVFEKYGFKTAAK
jgi:molybdate transport system substrate-binding protein